MPFQGQKTKHFLGEAFPLLIPLPCGEAEGRAPFPTPHPLIAFGASILALVPHRGKRVTLRFL